MYKLFISRKETKSEEKYILHPSFKSIEELIMFMNTFIRSVRPEEHQLYSYEIERTDI